VPRHVFWLKEAVSFALAIFSFSLYYITAGTVSSLDPIRSIVIPILAAATAIVSHEVAHKIVGRFVGCINWFALDKRGFLLTSLINVLLGLLSHHGIFFGGVYFSGYSKVYCPFPGFRGYMSLNYGLTGAAGPITNITLAMLFALVSHGFGSNELLRAFLSQSAHFNAWMAFFSLLPFNALDGKVVYEWSSVTWGVLFIYSIVLSFIL
jgi:Zn-dependent protease